MKQETQAIVDRFNSATYASCGFTEITRDGPAVCISHTGNMGDRIPSVNANLRSLNLPSIEQLREMFPDHKEKGSPDYAYTFRFALPADSLAERPRKHNMKKGYILLDDFGDRPPRPTRHYQQPARRLPVMPILVLLILIALLCGANLSAVIYLIVNQ